MRRKIEKRLLTWKDNPSRKPLLVHGARQTGKTYSILEFGRNNYQDVAYFDLEANQTVARSFVEDIEPASLLTMLESYIGRIIEPGRTLIVFDEIQSCPRALTSLKYFHDQAPQHHIIAAGSLLGVAIHRGEQSFPVGKIESATMYPLDFEEFLWAGGEGLLCDAIQTAFDSNIPLSEMLHLKAIGLYRAYLVTGGMPQAVNHYLEDKKLATILSVQQQMVDDYRADMVKYTSDSESVKIRSCYNSLPAQLAKDNRKFQYKIVQRGGSSSLFGSSIDWLEHAGIVLKCARVEHGYDPLTAHVDVSAFKLYVSDVGLLTQLSGISHHVVLSGAENTFTGALTENYVAQQLKAMGIELYYWTNQHTTAELDFVFQTQGGIVAVEVKKGLHVASRSLSEFMKRYHADKAWKVSLKNFGQADQWRSIPLYAVWCMKKDY